MTGVQTCALPILPLQGLTQGGQPIISYNFGANNPERVRKGFRLLLLSSVIYAACIWAVAELLPGVFVTIFTNDLQLAEFARWAMRIYMAAVLDDNNANYINMYDTNGEKIYSVKTTLSGDGYPIDVSISPDAKKLIASFIRVSGDEIKTDVVFYNFSDVGKNETERVVGGFNYDDVIVGDVKFINDTMAVAVGENVVSIYKIKEYPSLEHTIKIGRASCRERVSSPV